MALFDGLAPEDWARQSLHSQAVNYDVDDSSASRTIQLVSLNSAMLFSRPSMVDELELIAACQVRRGVGII